MAKKSATKKTGSKPKMRPKPKKRKKTSEPTDWTWRMLVILFIVALIAVVLYYTCRPQVKQTVEQVAHKTEQLVIAQPKEVKDEEVVAKEKSASQKRERVKYTNLEIPKWQTTTTQQQIKNMGYTSSYNTTIGMPNWVAYELTRSEAASDKVKRTNKFAPDPQVKGRSAQNSDYKGSGYDKGHMAPAADMKWNQTVMEQSFYFTNICPQAPGLNRGAWKDLEEETRQWAIRDSAIVIICGPLFTQEKINYIPRTKVAIPDAFFKVICAPYAQEERAIAFIFPNSKTTKKLDNYVVTIDSVEKLTGMDFLSELPDEVEEKIEQTSNYTLWN